MTTCQSWKKELLKDLNLLKVNFEDNFKEK
jgi:hypothetical protein